jgi:protein tyrosine/serine phosphatase
MVLDAGSGSTGPVQSAVERALAKQRTEATREVEAILDAALRVAERVAPAAPRVADIVAEAEISNQAFYRYFAGKDDLMRAVLERGVERLYTYLAHQTQKAEGGRAQVEAWIRGVLTQVTDRRAARQSAAVNLQLTGDGDPDQPRLRTLLIEPLTRAGSVAADRDAEVISEAVFGTMRRHLHNASAPDAAQCDHLIQFCLRGVTVAAPSATRSRWLNLSGGANARDLGGLPTEDGHRTRSGVLIRSANLQHLTEQDRRHLVTDLDVRRIVDLRSDVEVGKEGPGPMTESTEVVIHHLSLLPESTKVRDEVERPNVLFPGSDRTAPAVTDDPLANSYLMVLNTRPDSVVAALRAIAEPVGATVVHCAAGKDRTGMIVALALDLVGVRREAIVADFGASEERIDEINALLGRNSNYQAETKGGGLKAPKARVIEHVLDAFDAQPGGLPAWLAEQGWTAADTADLRAVLVD